MTTQEKIEKMIRKYYHLDVTAWDDALRDVYLYEARIEKKGEGYCVGQGGDFNRAIDRLYEQAKEKEWI